MSSTGSRRVVGGRLDLVANVCLTALTVVTVISLCRVFADWEYLRPMVTVAIGTHVVATLLRVTRVHLLVAVPVLLFTIVQLIAITYYRDTLVGPFPGARTLELFRIDVRLFIEQFPTAVAPVPSEGSYAVLAAVAIAICAVLSDTFAFRAMGRLEAIVPTGVLFTFTAALGTDRHRVGVAAAWIGMALLTVAVLRLRQADGAAAWMGGRSMRLAAVIPGVMLTFGLTAVVAAAVAPALPGAGEKALIDTRNRQGSVTEVLSPLVDIGAQLRNRGNLKVFTVRSNDGPHYWRAIGLPEFDGSLWEAAEEDLARMGDRSNEVPAGGDVTVQDIRIARLGGPLVPGAFRPVAVSPADVFWAAETQTLVLPDQSLREGDQIRVLSIVPRPTPEQLRNATTDNAPAGSLDLPRGVPQSARELAAAVTASATSPFEKALALQNWFRSEFEYDVNVQLGNSNDAIDAFLRERRGFCQQFAGTFAVMARAVGLPARVAVGYTPGELGPDGLYHVYGRHAHSWAEVWFDGIGWIPFEPTPGRGSPDATNYTDVQPEQAIGDGGAATEQTAPNTTVPIADPDASTTVPGGAIPGQNGSTTTVASGVAVEGGSGSSMPGVVVVLALLAALAAWVLFAPRVIRAMAARRAQSRRDRVATAWQRAVNVSLLDGSANRPGATPIEFARDAKKTAGAEHQALSELAIHVTRAVYAPSEVDEVTAARCESLADEIDAICRDRMPTSARVRTLFDPRLMRRRYAG